MDVLQQILFMEKFLDVPVFQVDCQSFVQDPRAPAGCKTLHLLLQILHLPGGLIFPGKAPDQHRKKAQLIKDTQDEPCPADAVYLYKTGEDADIEHKMHQHHREQKHQNQRDKSGQRFTVSVPAETDVGQLQYRNQHAGYTERTSFRLPPGAAAELVFPHPRNQRPESRKAGFFQKHPGTEDIQASHRDKKWLV